MNFTHVANNLLHKETENDMSIKSVSPLSGFDNSTALVSKIPAKTHIFNPSYPKISSYYPSYDGEGEYKIIISDVRVQSITKVILKLKLPEIKGEGTVAYLKYAPFHLLKHISVSFINPGDNKEQLLTNLTGEDLLMYHLSVTKTQQDKYNFNSKDSYCSEETGNYSDSIIFKERNIEIPISSHLLDNLSVFPNTTLVFSWVLNGIEGIITYNDTFLQKSLVELSRRFKSNDLQMKLQFQNCTEYVNYKDNDYRPKRYLQIKKTIGKNSSGVFNSAVFENNFGVSMTVKTDVFTNNNRFIINMGADTRSEKLMTKWILKILKDLIVISNKDLTVEANKIALGFKPESRFEEVINNTVYFDVDKREKCKIFIENICEGFKIYYHRNILTFTRRYQKNNVLNISELFRHIKGVCFYEDNNRIVFYPDQIKHKIPFNYISIPVNIWNHVNNTDHGDLRREESKKEDFYYNNSFIMGLDYLGSDKGYDEFSAIGNNEYFDYSYLNSRPAFDAKENYMKISELDENSYPCISYIPYLSLLSGKGGIFADKSIDFETFLTKIKFHTYPDYDPFDLYQKFPHLYIYEMFCICYDVDTQQMTVVPQSRP